MPLTDTKIRSAKPGEKPRKLADGQGLYLLLGPNRSRYWRFKYRFAGKEKLLSLGVYPATGLADARIKRDEARKLLAGGVDPSEQRRAEKQARAGTGSFEAVAREWFAKHKAGWAGSHASKIIGRLERDLFPWLGARPVGEISAPELLKVLRRVESRGRLETAHRELNIAGQVFRYAVASGQAERDPSGDLRGALAPCKPKHYASLTEPKDVAPLLQSIDCYQGGLVTRCALKLLALVFVRPGELRRAEWTEFDLEVAEWRIPAEKMKKRADHIVPLSRQAVAILCELEPLTGQGRYVFPSVRSTTRPMSENTLNAALDYMGYGSERMRAHGFRAMARTMLDEQLGFRVDFIEHQQAHRVRDPLGRAYNRTKHLKERGVMMQAWADYLDGLKTGNNVIPIHGSRSTE